MRNRFHGPARNSASYLQSGPPPPHETPRESNHPKKEAPNPEKRFGLRWCGENRQGYINFVGRKLKEIIIHTVWYGVPCTIIPSARGPLLPLLLVFVVWSGLVCWDQGANIRTRTSREESSLGWMVRMTVYLEAHWHGRRIM